MQHVNITQPPTHPPPRPPSICTEIWLYTGKRNTEISQGKAIRNFVIGNFGYFSVQGQRSNYLSRAMAYGSYPLGWRSDRWSRANPVHRRGGGGYESHSRGKLGKSKYSKQVISKSKADSFIYALLTLNLVVFYLER